MPQVHKFISHDNIRDYSHYEYGKMDISIFDCNADLLLLAYELVQNFYNYLIHLTATVNIFGMKNTPKDRLLDLWNFWQLSLPLVTPFSFIRCTISSLAELVTLIECVLLGIFMKFFKLIFIWPIWKCLFGHLFSLSCWLGLHTQPERWPSTGFMRIHSLRRCPNTKQRVFDTVTTLPLVSSVLHKHKRTITQIKDADPILLSCWF